MLQLYLRHAIYNILFKIKQGYPPPQEKFLALHLQQPANYPFPSRLQSKIAVFLDVTTWCAMLVVPSCIHISPAYKPQPLSPSTHFNSIMPTPRSPK